MFVLGAVLMSLGSVLAVGMLAPIAMPIARKYKIDPLLMGMMISHGVLGAAFSPITVYGAFTNGWLAEAGLPTNPLALYLIPLGLNFVIALALFLIRGRDLLRKDDTPVEAVTDTSTGGTPAASGTSGTGPAGTAPTGGVTTVAVPAAATVLAASTSPMRAADADGEKPATRRSGS